MSALPAQTHWQRYLPPGLLWFIDHKLKRSLTDLQEVGVSARDAGQFYGSLISPLRQMRTTQRLTYTLRFVDGQVTELEPFRDGLWWPLLISEYNDVLHPYEWIHRFILEAADDAPDYSDPLQAYKVLARLLRRPDEDNLLQVFCRLLLAGEQLEPHERVPVVRLYIIAPPWTPRQICTAAYHAYLEIQREKYRL